ncbi:MAG: tail fiber domain-containing protein [Sphingobacteriales bacterium]|nr:tail fiber domain-containing protein [Sphingobacteriales bacterium]
MIGAESGNNADNFSNSTALGYQAPITGSNQVNIGNTSISSIKGQVGFTTYSDQRFKTNVQTDVLGLDFIMKLRPLPTS